MPCSEFFKNQDHCKDHHVECKCKPNDRVPAKELSFLHDQRGARKMIMVGLDKKTTKTLQESEKRKAAFEEQKKRRKSGKKQNLKRIKRPLQIFFQTHQTHQTHRTHQAHKTLRTQVGSHRLAHQYKCPRPETTILFLRQPWFVTGGGFQARQQLTSVMHMQRTWGS